MGRGACSWEGIGLAALRLHRRLAVVVVRIVLGAPIPALRSAARRLSRWRQARNDAGCIRANPTATRGVLPLIPMRCYGPSSSGAVSVRNALTNTGRSWHAAGVRPHRLENLRQSQRRNRGTFLARPFSEGFRHYRYGAGQ